MTLKRRKLCLLSEIINANEWTLNRNTKNLLGLEIAFFHMGLYLLLICAIFHSITYSQLHFEPVWLWAVLNTKQTKQSLSDSLTLSPLPAEVKIHKASLECIYNNGIKYVSLNSRV